MLESKLSVLTPTPFVLLIGRILGLTSFNPVVFLRIFTTGSPRLNSRSTLVMTLLDTTSNTTRSGAIR